MIFNACLSQLIRVLDRATRLLWGGRDRFALFGIALALSLAIGSIVSDASPSGNAVNVSVNWNHVQAQTNRLQFGLNAFQGFEPKNQSNLAYSHNLSWMNPGLIRFHHAGAMLDSSAAEGLIDTVHRTWDAEKIVQSLQSSLHAFDDHQPERMINIPTFPSWMDADEDGYLDADQFDSYAQFCADLVKIVNQDHRLNVKYWEVTNEKDQSYYIDFHSNNGWGGLINANQPDRLPELITIYNKAAAAMKQVDPAIQVGGASIARPDLAPFYVPFIRGTVEQLDFFSYHAYAAGSAETADAEVYGKAEQIGEFTQQIIQALKQASPDRDIPAFLDEYNISWTWETRDPRMANHKGAVFDALTMIAAIQNGVGGTAAWNEKDDIYGKTSNQDEPRLSAHLFHLLNQWFVGDRVETTSRSQITTLAVRNIAQTRKTYVLVNAASVDQTVRTNFNGWQLPQRAEQHRISASGYSQASIDPHLLTSGFSLPADSITILNFAS